MEQPYLAVRYDYAGKTDEIRETDDFETAKTWMQAYIDVLEEEGFKWEVIPSAGRIVIQPKDIETKDSFVVFKVDTSWVFGL